MVSIFIGSYDSPSARARSQSRNPWKTAMDDECPFDGGEVPVARVARPPKLVVQADSEIERVAKTPMESLSFKDFISLKSGRDQFSKMKLDDLQSAIGKLDAEKLAVEFHDDSKTQA